MGYSCTVAASKTLEKLESFHQRAHGQYMQSILTDTTGKIVGFYEISRERADGAIVGKVMRFTDFEIGRVTNYAVPAGSFHIAPDGAIKRFPLGRLKDFKEMCIIG